VEIILALFLANTGGQYRLTVRNGGHLTVIGHNTQLIQEAVWLKRHIAVGSYLANANV
jgi:hypothetical protein